LRDIRQLREAGLPLKLIIEAANRGEDLGPEGRLWLAAGRIRIGDPAVADPGPPGVGVREPGVGSVGGPPFVVDPKAYAIMQTLTSRGLTPSTVLLLALRTARASSELAADLRDLLAAEVQGLALAAPELPPPAQDDVIDLATTITREMLGHTLAVSNRQ